MYARLFLTCLLTLALASTASAGSVPVVYFLKDTDAGAATDGVLDWAPPDPADLQNPANNTPPSLRLVTAMKAEQFVRPEAANNTGRILGPVIVGLWAPETPLINEATLVIELGLFSEGLTPLMMEGEPIASARIPIEGGNITPPDPANFVPPDPSDPEGSAAYVAAQAQAYALPLVLQAPYVILLATEDGTGLDLEVDPDARIGLRFLLEAPDGSLLPAPTGLGQPIEYDFGLAPTFVYVPWYEPDPPRPTATATSTTTGSSDPAGSRGPSTIGPAEGQDDGGKDSPVPIVLVPAALVVAALFLRRRQG